MRKAALFIQFLPGLNNTDK